MISLLIKPLYESKVILYPSSNIADTRTLLGEGLSYATLFGDDDGTEKLLQILNSEQVREYLKAKYNLASHYRIKPSSKYPNTLIAQKMKKYINSSKTSYGSVEVRVRDWDRTLACEMANDIAARADTIFNNLQRRASEGTLSELDKIYENQLVLVKQYEDSLKGLPVFGGFRETGNAGSIYEVYYESLMSGDRKSMDNLKKQLSTGDKTMVNYLRLLTTLESETDYLSRIRAQHLEAQALSRQVLPYTLVVDKATVAEKKVYPKRSLMVIVSVASFLLLIALVLFIAEGIKLHRPDDQQ